MPMPMTYDQFSNVMSTATATVSTVTGTKPGHLSCIACKVVRPVEKIASEYSKDIFDHLAPAAYDIFRYFVMFWILYTLLQAVTKQLNSPAKILEKAKQLMGFTIIVTLLQHQEWVWEIFYDPLQNFFEEFMKFILSVNMHEKVKLGEDQKGYLAGIDIILQEMYALGSSMMSGNSFLVPLKLFSGFFIMLIYGCICFVAIFYVVELLYAVFIISSFTPLLLVAAGFKPTRDNAKAAVQILFNNIMTVLFSILGVSILLVVYNELFSGIAPNGSAKSINLLAVGDNWLACILVGLVCLLQQKKSKDLANNLSRVSESAGITMAAAGIATTAVAVAFMGGKGLLVAGASKGLQKMGLSSKPTGAGGAAEVLPASELGAATI